VVCCIGVCCYLLYRSRDEEKLSDAVLERCGSHSGILHIGIADISSHAPVSLCVTCFMNACHT